MFNEEQRERMGMMSVSDVVKRSRVRWLGHMMWKDGGDWAKSTRKAKDSMESNDEEGYERQWAEDGQCM